MSDPAPVAVTFDYSPWEHFAFQRALMRRWTWYLFYAITVGVPLVLLMLIFLGNTGLPQDRRVAFSDVFALFAFPAIALVLIPAMQLSRAYWHRRTHTIPHTKHTIGLSASGLESSCVAAKLTVPWEAIYRVIETPRFFLFYISKVAACSLPKRALNGHAEESLVREWITTRVDNRARLLA